MKTKWISYLIVRWTGKKEEKNETHKILFDRPMFTTW